MKIRSAALVMVLGLPSSIQRSGCHAAWVSSLYSSAPRTARCRSLSRSMSASAIDDMSTFVSTTTPAIGPNPPPETLSSLLQKGRTKRRRVFRPDPQDVERISWGKPARRKGTGSRGVPHRLNDDERRLWDRHRHQGVLPVVGSAWRSQRREAPLLNSWRSWCDAKAQVCIVLHKASGRNNNASDGILEGDQVVVDISPLRLEHASECQQVAQFLLHERPGGIATSNAEIKRDENWAMRPIYQLPPYCIAWESLSRSDAKALAQHLAVLCQTVTVNKNTNKTWKSQKPIGVKPGKSRRHGGYGIG